VAGESSRPPVVVRLCLRCFHRFWTFFAPDPEWRGTRLCRPLLFVFCFVLPVFCRRFFETEAQLRGTRLVCPLLSRSFAVCGAGDAVAGASPRFFVFPVVFCVTQPSFLGSNAERECPERVGNGADRPAAVSKTPFWKPPIQRSIDEETDRGAVLYLQI